METTSFVVKSGEFEGPLALLLNLIEKRKLFINEVSLAGITDDYISHINAKEKGNLSDYTTFITVAATLILVKSRSLLPNMKLTDDEESDIAKLQSRLELYKIIQEVGEEIKEQYGKTIIFPRLEKKIETKIFAPDSQISVESIFQNISEVIQAIPEEKEKNPEVEIMNVKTIEEMINDLSERIHESFQMSFSEFSKSHSYANTKEEKVGVIVGFLAMLELVRTGLIEAFQNTDFEEINLQKQEVIASDEVQS